MCQFRVKHVLGSTVHLPEGAGIVFILMAAVEPPIDTSFFKNFMDYHVIQEPEIASAGVLFLRSI